MSAHSLVVSAIARVDIQAILEISEGEFGPRARARYADLIGAALEALRQNPTRPGATLRPDIGEGVFVFHLAHARRFRARERVRRPRHLIVFKIANSGTVLIGRVLHDAMDIVQHVPED